jgi:hypothetical protein
VIGAKDRPSWIPVFGKSGFASCRATSKNPPVLQSGLSLPIPQKEISAARSNATASFLLFDNSNHVSTTVAFHNRLLASR